MAEESRKLNVLALGLAGGVLWTFCMLFIGVAAEYFNWCVQLRELIGSLYVGSTDGNLGILIGMVWGFFDAFIGLAVFGWLYNAFAGSCCKPRTES
jgi:hypothetical protein